jgi:geranylgeranyl pyrophosphate synthase
VTGATEAFRLEPFLNTTRARCNAALERALARLLPPIPEELAQVASHGVLAGGKRLRPILFVSCFDASSSSRSSHSELEDSVYDLAVSLELIHAYSLMHDDLPCMDDADLRRGAPTPHTLYGETPTMTAALLLIPMAGMQAWWAGKRLGLNEARRRSLLRLLYAAAGASGMVGGQALDLLGEGRDLSREALDDLHARKTGRLLGAAARMGGIAGGASEPVQMAVDHYGHALGLAFQIADDVLDATAEADALGKNPSDTDLRKSTYVTMLGVDAARREANRWTRTATDALSNAGIRSDELEALAWYIVRRDR